MNALESNPPDQDGFCGKTTIIRPKPRDLGGFSVLRVLPSPETQMVGPFIFFDHFGPVAFEPGQGINVRPHPHIGLATLTYLFEGEIFHRDSLGNALAIKPGAVNWMTAGRGIVHSERERPEIKNVPHRLHGIQSWIALPKANEEDPPAFFHHGADALPVIEEGGARLRLIIGQAYGKSSPVKTYSPMFYLGVDAPAGSRFSMPDTYAERALYVADGSVTVDGESLKSREMLTLAAGAPGKVMVGEASHLMLLGGSSMGGRRHIWWNFVASSKERIARAKEDWSAGRFGIVPGDEDEFIPLPER